MRVLSATEAINPAIEHTKALLRPFSLRLAAVSSIGLLGGAPSLGNSHLSQ